MLVDNLIAVLPAVLPVVTVAFVLQIVISVLLPKLVLQWRLRHIPIANKEPGEWFDSKAIDRAQTNAMGIMRDAYARVSLVMSYPSLIDNVNASNSTLHSSMGGHTS